MRITRPMVGRSVENRQCLYFNVCGKFEVYTGRWKEHWHPYQDGYLCKNHYGQLVSNKRRTKEQRRRYNEKYSKSKIKFIDRQIVVKENPKTGYCSWCSNNVYDGSCKKTNMHHVKYDNKNILANTIEICSSCHAKETSRLRERKDRSNWFCAICGSKTTHYNAKTNKYHWTNYRNGHLCHKCYCKLNYHKYYKKKKG